MTQLLKATLKDPNFVVFNAKIGSNHQADFNNHSSLLHHLCHELLPIFDASHGYDFVVEFQSDRNSASNLVASIVQLPQVTRCSKVIFRLYTEPKHLPIEAISNWLSHKTHKKEDEIDGLINPQKRLLGIYSLCCIQNAREMCDYLKAVRDCVFIKQ